jgi:two-component system nitrogen regulation response regulator GlnG
MKGDETDWRDGETRMTTATEETPERRPDSLPCLTVLAHADPRRVGERLTLPVLALGREVRLSRLEPEFRRPEAPGEPGRPLEERSLSRQPVLLHGVRASGSVVLDRNESRTPLAADGEAVEGGRSFSAAEVERGVVLQLGRHVAPLLHRMRPPEGEPPRFGLVGESEAIVRLRQEIEQLSPLDVPVLLRGETGTGKELVARALHDGGPRAGGPFVAVNMATLSPSLAAAELFGAERGAYTGAERKKKGFFLAAEGGTLLLDEIGETPVEVQAMLLRALENREVVPVGGVEARRVDVRVIAATDAALEEAIAAGRFRRPLFHRLAGYRVHVPALRERRDDVGRLLYSFLDEELSEAGGEAPAADGRPWPPAEVVARLARYDWPGNVRELRNVARRLALAGPDAPAEEIGVVLDELLGEPRPPAPPPEERPAAPVYRQPHEIGDEELLEALAAHRWRIQPTAAHLRVSRTSLYAMIDRSPQIRRASEIGAEELLDCKERHGGDFEAMATELKVSPSGLRQRLRQLAVESRG